MLDKILGGLVDKEKATYETVKSTLENVAEELDRPFNDFFIMIAPQDSEMNFKCYIYQLGAKGPELVREITLKEIVNPDE